MTRSNSQTGAQLDRSHAYRIMDSLPIELRRAVTERDYDWHPDYIRQLYVQHGTEGAIHQLRLDDFFKHRQIEKKEGRTVHGQDDAFGWKLYPRSLFR